MRWAYPASATDHLAAAGLAGGGRRLVVCEEPGGQGDGPGASGRPGGPSAASVSGCGGQARHARAGQQHWHHERPRHLGGAHRVSGELERFFKEGDEVRAGQLLAQIDARGYRARAAAAQGTLQRDQALLKNAQLDLGATRSCRRKIPSPASRWTPGGLVRQYQGTVAADQAQVDAARLQRLHAHHRADCAGAWACARRIWQCAEPLGRGGIVTITQVRPIDALFSVPEAHVGAIARALAEKRALPRGAVGPQQRACWPPGA